MIKEINKEKTAFDKVAAHPLQSWAWGEFRKDGGIEVLRLGEYKKAKLVKSFQITFHRLPGLSWRIGYCPKSELPSREMLRRVRQEAKKRKAIMVKFEPNVLKRGEKKN